MTIKRTENISAAGIGWLGLMKPGSLSMTIVATTQTVTHKPNCKTDTAAQPPTMPRRASDDPQNQTVKNTLVNNLKV